MGDNRRNCDEILSLRIGHVHTEQEHTRFVSSVSKKQHILQRYLYSLAARSHPELRFGSEQCVLRVIGRGNLCISPETKPFCARYGSRMPPVLSSSTRTYLTFAAKLSEQVVVLVLLPLFCDDPGHCLLRCYVVWTRLRENSRFPQVVSREFATAVFNILR